MLYIKAENPRFPKDLSQSNVAQAYFLQLMQSA